MVDRTGLFVKPLPGSPPQGTSPTDGRLVLGALAGTTGGCLTGGTMTASSSLMQVTVAAAVWRIPDPTNSAAVALSPADTATLTFSAGPASGSRIDVIWVRQNNYEAGDANSRVVYGVAAGTAAATPVAPAVPAGALKIGQLTVPAGVSNAAAATLVTSYPASVPLLPVTAPSKTQLDLITGQYTGQRAVVGDAEYRWNGTAWSLWNWTNVPYSTFGQLMNSAQTEAAAPLEVSVINGVLFMNFGLTLSGSAMAYNTPYLQMKPGFRPPLRIDDTGVSLASTSSILAFYVLADGTLQGFFSTGSAPNSMRGKVSYRIAG